ncbi:MAG TPA: YciI family protein [Pirellulaceae bacterium]|jgi:hypothetical protein|nr:YciI family protein [Pirellulaceae bacterium]
MRYLLLIHWDEEKLANLPPAEREGLNARHVAFNRELQASGHFIEAEALSPSTLAACVRVRDGKPEVVDGPFAEAKEMVGGFYLIEAADLPEALTIAQRVPSAPYATVEVRPTMRLTQNGEIIW